MMATAAKARGKYRAPSSYGNVPYGAYDGSAVRKLEEAQVLQPRPQVRPRQRAIVRPRVRVRQAGEVSVFAVVGFLAVGVFAVLLLFSYVQLTAISESVVDLKNQMTTLQTEEAKLRAQYELAYDLGTIEQQVTAQGMVKPQSGQIYYVDLSEPDKVTQFQQEDAVSGVAGALDSIQSIFSQIVEYLR
jgi:hypothetical protein